MRDRKQRRNIAIAVFIGISLVGGSFAYQHYAKLSAARAEATRKAERQVWIMQRLDRLLEEGQLRKARRLLHEQYATQDPEIINSEALQQREQTLAVKTEEQKAAHEAAEAQKRRAEAAALKAKLELAKRRAALEARIDSARQACRNAIKAHAPEHRSLEFLSIEVKTSLEQGISMTLDWLAHKPFGERERAQSVCTYKDDQVVQLSMNDNLVIDQT